MRKLLTIAHLTLHEAQRRRILLAALLLGMAFLLIFGTGFWHVDASLRAEPKMTEQQRHLMYNFVVMAGLYAVNFLTVMAAVLLPVDTMSGEIESGVMQSIATKPIRRSEILLGKWLGFSTVMGLYLTLMAGGVLVIARAIAGFTPPNVALGVPLLFLEGLVLLTLSIAGGTRLGTLANGVLCFGCYGLAFIGGWMEQIGTHLGSATTRNVGIVASLLVPSEAIWQLASYHMQPPLMRDVNLTPFSFVSVPSTAMIGWAAAYIVALLAFALWSLERRDL
jgi:ABC-type transport system involved in multi-copper enzyme maturation permease subunit